MGRRKLKRVQASLGGGGMENLSPLLEQMRNGDHSSLPSLLANRFAFVQSSLQGVQSVQMYAHPRLPFIGIPCLDLSSFRLHLTNRTSSLSWASHWPGMIR